MCPWKYFKASNTFQISYLDDELQYPDCKIFDFGTLGR